MSKQANKNTVNAAVVWPDGKLCKLSKSTPLTVCIKFKLLMAFVGRACSGKLFFKPCTNIVEIISAITINGKNCRLKKITNKNRVTHPASSPRCVIKAKLASANKP